MTEEYKRRCRFDTLEELAEMRARHRGLVTKTALATEPNRTPSLTGQYPEKEDWPAYSDLAGILEDMRSPADAFIF